MTTRRVPRATSKPSERVEVLPSSSADYSNKIKIKELKIQSNKYIILLFSEVEELRLFLNLADHYEYLTLKYPTLEKGLSRQVKRMRLTVKAVYGCLYNMKHTREKEIILPRMTSCTLSRTRFIS